MINIKYIRFFLRLLCSFLIVNSMTLQAMEREFIDIITSNDKSYLVASIFREKAPVKRPLLKFENALKGGDNSKPVAVLKEYYELMIQGEPKKAAKLFYPNDGSRERYIKGLIDMPTRYDGYQNLERIDFLDSFGWGPFRIYEVKLSGRTSGSMRWREAVACSLQKCYISNQIDKADSASKDFSSIRRLLSKSTNQQQALNDAFDSFDNKALYLPTDAITYSNFQNIQYPMTFSFEMKTVTPFMLNWNSPSVSGAQQTINGVDLSALSSLIRDLNALSPMVENIDLKTQADTDAEKSEVIDAYNSTVSQYAAANASNDIFLYSVFENEKTQQREFKREWYHPIAAIQRISRWQDITILGFIPQNDNTVAVFFQPRSKDQFGEVKIEPIQGIALQKTATSSKLLLTNFRNNTTQTINFALEAPVLSVLGDKYADTPTLIYNL